MQGQGRLTGLTQNLDGTYNITITVREDIRKQYAKLKDGPVECKIERHYNHRGNAENALMWALCRDIGRAIGSTDIDVYRRTIHEVGVFEPTVVRSDHVERFIKSWEKKGDAWFADVIDDSKFAGYKLVHLYYGSSVYNTAEMHRVLRDLIEEAEMLGIRIQASRDQIEQYKRLWGPRADEQRGDTKHG